MSISVLNPDGLPKPDLYRQVSIATGARMVFLAGQVARDGDGGRVGEGDLAAQVEQSCVNVHTALAAAGATFDDVAKLTVYLVGWSEEKAAQLTEGMDRAWTRLGIDAPHVPLTGIGVAALAEPDLLVEIEAIAVIE